MPTANTSAAASIRRKRCAIRSAQGTHSARDASSSWTVAARCKPHSSSDQNWPAPRSVTLGLTIWAGKYPPFWRVVRSELRKIKSEVIQWNDFLFVFTFLKQMNRNNLPWYELPHLFLPESVKRKPTKKKSWAWEQKHVLLLLLLSRTTIAIITSIGRGICVAFLLVTLLCYIYSSNVRKKIGQHFFFVFYA